MSLMLGIRYLMGWSMAADQTRERAEWPPHPDRVFMALAAAYFEGDRLKEERAALEWLEGLPAPGIAAGEAFEREVVTSYVPVNDTEISKKGETSKQLAAVEKLTSLAKAKDSGLAVLPEFRVRQARVFPVVVPVSAAVLREGAGTSQPDDGMPRVYFVWEGVAVSEAHRAGLMSLCAKVTSLGHSASLVQMWVEDGRAEADWVPEREAGAKASSDAVVRVRVIGVGRLRDLEEAFGTEDKALGVCGAQVPQRPVPRVTAAYRRRQAGAGEKATVSHSCFEPSLMVFKRVSGPRLGLESVATLAKAFRGLVQKKCDPAPAWLTGHEPDGSAMRGPHAAVLPMAFVGREHATGDVMGVALVAPRGLTRDDRQCLTRLMPPDSGVHHELTMGEIGAWQLELAEPDERQLNLRAATWTAVQRGATTWATVTPIVFDRHSKQAWTRDDPPRVRAEAQAAYWEEIESMIADGCERIGLPRPGSVVARSESGLIGVPRSDRFARMLRKDGSAQRHTHAVITFTEPVVGPVLVGAGRYKGYGVCRPLPADQEGTR